MADLITEISNLAEDDIEQIEQLTMRWLFQAIVDFGVEPVIIFRKSPDAVRDVAEDVTREVLDRLAGYNIRQRVFGNVDYKRARYVILPDQVIRQALFVDSKAEKSTTSVLSFRYLTVVHSSCILEPKPHRRSDAHWTTDSAADVDGGGARDVGALD